MRESLTTQFPYKPYQCGVGEEGNKNVPKISLIMGREKWGKKRRNPILKVLFYGRWE